jgi:argininosuccinate lyase
MQTMTFVAHNNRTGMFDYRMYDPVPYARALTVFKLFGSVVDAVVVNKARALEEVNADYSTTTEIADALLQKAEVPFRTGHHFASKLTDYGRGKGLKIHEIPYSEAQRIYEEQAKDKLPLTEAEFREVISAEYMVFGRKGLGGPQALEANRMHVEKCAEKNRDTAWLQAQSSLLNRKSIFLEKQFSPFLTSDR